MLNHILLLVLLELLGVMLTSNWVGSCPLREGGKRLRDQIGRDFTKPGGISITHNMDDMERYLQMK